MARVEVVQPYVEKLLRAFSGLRELVVDDDGDIPFRKGSTMYWVSLFENAGEAQVRVWSFVARGVAPSPAMYEHLNHINADIRYGRVYWEDGDVVISTELLAETLDARELENACQCIGGASDAHDDELVRRFGGATFFPSDLQAAVPGRPAVDDPAAAEIDL